MTNDYTIVPPPGPSAPPSFIPSSRFVESVNGYVFYLGPNGLGYYLDNH